MRRVLQILFYVAAGIYPIFMFCFLVIWHIPPRLLSLFVMGFGGVYFLAATSRGKRSGTMVISAGLLLGVGALCLITNSALSLKLYPVLMNGTLLMLFAGTFFFPPVIIFRFALLQDKTIRGSLAESRVEAYCRKVTLVWCGFFILNGGIALYTVFSPSPALWSIYNGGISYLLIGLLFLGELIIRRITDAKMPKAIPLSGFQRNSRPPDTVLCYEERWGTGPVKTWGDFLEDTAQLRRIIRARPGSPGGAAAASPEPWILYAEDRWYVLVALTALLQCEKTILLTDTLSSARIRKNPSGDTVLLTDQEIPRGSDPAGGTILYLPALLDPQGEGPAAHPPHPPGSSSPADREPIPAIRGDAGAILLPPAEGSAGAGARRLAEFEGPIRDILSRWGEEALKRVCCSTLSPRHPWGFLVSILLPFTAGVPFRRKGIRLPGEFPTLTGASYLIFTTPAFLEKAVETRSVEGEPAGTPIPAASPPLSGGWNLENPWIFTVGGVLSPELARKTRGIFGCWPLELAESAPAGLNPGEVESAPAGLNPGEVESAPVGLNPGEVESDPGELNPGDFAGDMMDTISGMRTIPRERVVKRAPGRVVLEFSIPGDCEYFDGHFPDFRLFPGVAQVELVIRLAGRYLGTAVHASRIKRIKFSKIIFPDTPIRVELSCREEQRELSFQFTDPPGELVYSSGSLVLGAPETASGTGPRAARAGETPEAGGEGG